MVLNPAIFEKLKRELLIQIKSFLMSFERGLFLESSGLDLANLHFHFFLSLFIDNL
jgi:hypothetical protein